MRCFQVLLQLPSADLPHYIFFSLRSSALALSMQRWRTSPKMTDFPPSYQRRLEDSLRDTRECIFNTRQYRVPSPWGWARGLGGAGQWGTTSGGDALVKLKRKQGDPNGISHLGQRSNDYTGQNSIGLLAALRSGVQVRRCG